MTNLFDICASNHKGASTSVQANASLDQLKPTLRIEVLAFIEAEPFGATCEEIEFGCGIKHQTASARVSELLRLGSIQITGQRPTSSGRMARVYGGVE